MKKKYTSPEIKTVKFDADDIIRTSGETPSETMPKTLIGAETLKTQDFNIFE